MSKNLTEKEQKFLDVLYEEAEGDVVEAVRLAGYAKGTSSKRVVNALSDEIAELTKSFIKTKGQIKAAWAMVNALDNSEALGLKYKLQASKEILDRAGLVKTEKMEVTPTSPLFIIPAKKEDED